MSEANTARPVTISDRTRRTLLFQRSNGKCFYCGGPVFEPDCHHSHDWLPVRPDGSSMVREHMVPTIRGGSNEAKNIACSCRSCNSLKGSFTADEYRTLISLRRGDLNYRFAGEVQSEICRDWLTCHSDSFERDLVTHNIPSAAQAYALRGNSYGRSTTWRPQAARGQKGRQF